MIAWQPGMKLKDLEKLVILHAMKFYGSRATTASSLGIAPRTLDYKLAEYEGRSEHAEPGTNTGNETAPEATDTKELAVAPTRIHVESPSESAKKPSMPVRKRG